MTTRPKTRTARRQQSRRGSIGFTLLETIVVLLIISVLFAIAAPTWTHLLNTQRLNVAQDQIFQAIRTAQNSAKTNHTDWQFSLRESNGIVQWATHMDTVTSRGDNEAKRQTGSSSSPLTLVEKRPVSGA